MKEEKVKKKRKIARTRRTRSKILLASKIGERMRLSVFRSNRYLYAQVIDDKNQKTVLSVNEKEIEKGKKSTKTERAELLGKLLADKAQKKKINNVTFDKGSYRYHGRVKAFADAARAQGLAF